jgi:putative inorganic carbon (HCO3(-)) transporter
MWLVVVLAAVCTVSECLLLPTLIIATFFWPLRWLVSRRFSQSTPLDRPAVFWGLWLIVPLLATALPEITQPQVYRLLLGLALCYAIANHAWSQASLRWALACLVGLGVGLGLVALVSVDWFFDNKLALMPMGILKELPHLMGEQIHPNVMAGTLVLLTLFAPGRLLFGDRQMAWWSWTLLSLATGFLLVVLLLTKSRGAWLALVAGLIVLVILRWPYWGSVLVWGFGVADAALLVSYPDLVQELILGNGTFINLSSFAGRQEIWSAAIAMIRDFPLTGIGMGTFPQVLRALYPSFLLSINAGTPHAHNLFLQIAVDLGLPGLALWLIMVAILLRCAWQVYRAGQRQAGWLAALGAGLIAAQVAMLTHGLVDAVIWGTRPAIVVWGLWGLTLAAWRVTSAPDRNLPSTG